MRTSKLFNYQCKICGTLIPTNTNGVFTRCSCGKIAVDGNRYYSRLIGNRDYFAQVPVDVVEETFVYRIKQVNTGLFYGGGNVKSFTSIGRFYTRKPSLSWPNVKRHGGEFMVEKYKVERATV